MARSTGRARRTWRYLLGASALALVASALIVPSAPKPAAAHHGLGLVPVPPMGANPFGYHGLKRYDDESLCHDGQVIPGIRPCQVLSTTEVVLAQGEALVRPIPGRADGKSLADLGYNVLQLDGQWQGPRLDPTTGDVDPVNGEITANPVGYPDADTTNNRYPGDNVDDFTNLISQVKSMCGPVTGRCLQVGIYSDWGTGINCPVPGSYAETRNGLYQHEAADAATFASWGFDFLKLDGLCQDIPDAFAEFQVIHDAFATHAPNIAIDIYWHGITSDYSNIWRPGGDHSGTFLPDSIDDQSGILERLDVADSLGAQDVVGPGNWADMDNLLVSGANGGFFGTMSWLTLTEQRTQFGLAALLASPLLIGADVRTVVGVPGDPNYPGDADALDFLTNEAVIAVGQDTQGDMARKVDGDADYDVRSKIISGGGQAGTRAVGLLNRTEVDRDITVRMDTLRRDDGSLGGGLHDVTEVTDLWTGSDVSGSCNAELTECTLTVPAHGLALLRVVGTSDGQPAGLTNGDFETGDLDPWANYNPAAVASVVGGGEQQNGDWGLHVPASAGGTASGVSQTFSVDNGQYTVACWLRTSSTDDFVEVAAEGYSGGGDYVSDSTNATDWDLRQVNVTVTTGQITILIFRPEGTGNGDAYADDCTLT